MANTTESFLWGGDAALCQITLTTSWYSFTSWRSSIRCCGTTPLE